MVDHVTFEQNEIYLLKQREVAVEWLLQILKDKTKALRKHNWKNISSLNLRIERCSDVTSESLYQLIKGFSQQLPNLRKFILNLDWCEEISDEQLRVIGVTIRKHFTCLETLHLRFAMSELITENGLKALGRELKKPLFNLTDLTLHLSNCYNINGKGVKELLTKACISNSRLRNLTLGLDSNGDLNDQDIEIVMPEVGKLKLEKLGLILSCCQKLTDVTLQSIITQFATLSGLQKLKLGLKMCEGLTEKGTQEILSAINSSLINLKQLSLDFQLSKSTLTSDNVCAFANTMQGRLSSIESFTVFGIGGTKQDYSKGFEALGAIFRNSMTNLQSLTIESRFAKFSTESFVEFSKNIGFLSQLKKLEMIFEYSSSFNYTCVENLISAVVKNLTKLEYLSLSFNSCENITEKGLEQIGLDLGESSLKLKYLKLDFSGVKLITDTGLKIFASNIAPCLHSLKSLALNFSLLIMDKKIPENRGFKSNIYDSCDKIKGKGLAELFSGIGDNLESLQEFTFDLMSLPLEDEDFKIWAPTIGKGMTKLKSISLCLIYQDFSDRAVEALALGISQNLSHLQELTFNIEECTRITDQALEFFCPEIKAKFRNLFKLQLNLERRNSVTIRARDKWRKELEFIPNLLIF